MLVKRSAVHKIGRGKKPGNLFKSKHGFVLPPALSSRIGLARADRADTSYDASFWPGVTIRS